MITSPREAGPPVVRTFFEPELLGSAGTLAANRHWVDGEEMFLAVQRRQPHGF